MAVVLFQQTSENCIDCFLLPFPLGKPITDTHIANPISQFLSVIQSTDHSSSQAAFKLSTPSVYQLFSCLSAATTLMSSFMIY